MILELIGEKEKGKEKDNHTRIHENKKKMINN